MNRANRIRQGFSLVELLVSLALMATLLAAVATAMHSSLLTYSENDKLEAVTQAARAILNRLSAEVRTAESITSTTSSLTITQSDGTIVEYEYESGAMYYRRQTDEEPVSHLLMGSDDEVRLTAFSVLREEGPDAEGNICTTSVTIRMTFVVGSRSMSVTTTSAVRRNQDF